MWALVINPVAGQGKGATVGTYVAGYLNNASVPYAIITGKSAKALTDHLENFLKNHPTCQRVIAVGGDGLLHIVLQKVIPAHIPITVIPAGTGNDFVRSLGWDLSNVDIQLNHVLNNEPTPMDLGLVDGEWFASRSIVNGSAVGVKAAEKRKIPKIQIRQGRRIVLPLKKPMRLKVKRKTGNSNARPNKRMIRKTKSK